ncbi:hypothetical protein [Streptomyces chilikensis]|nr:hypothetical protein [Streptomyces chilikensis]
MSLKINAVLAAAFVLFILWFGSEFTLRPETVAPDSDSSPYERARPTL